MTLAARLRLILLCAAALPGLVACGGGSSSGTIGGNLSGLNTGQTVVLQDNLSDNLTLNANGAFTFATQVSSGSGYSVTVLTQPVGQNCTVGSGSGTVDTAGDDVNTVSVVCTTTSTIGGSVSGLAAGASVTLALSGTTTNGTVPQLAIPSNGAFAFPGVVGQGVAYTVTVAVQPIGQTCSVANGSGTVGTTTITNVLVTCS